MKKVAVLLTCHNRKKQTVACLNAFYKSSTVSGYVFDIFFVDDGSTDGTTLAVEHKYPLVKIILGDGNLFWAGGMRLAWRTALASPSEYDYYLLLNDDTHLFSDALHNLLDDLRLIQDEKVILVGSTLNSAQTAHTYGGQKLYTNESPKGFKLIPNNEFPQECDLGNANVMLVSKGVVETIGILSDKYTHGIADFDYTLRAKKRDIKIYISSKYLGTCENDHGNTWMAIDSSLKQRINYLYSVKGLAYGEYLFFIKTHFPAYIFKAKCKLWLKTIFPIIWEKFKK